MLQRGVQGEFLNQGNLRGAERPVRSPQLPPQQLRRPRWGQGQCQERHPTSPAEAPGERWRPGWPNRAQGGSWHRKGAVALPARPGSDVTYPAESHGLSKLCTHCSIPGRALVGTRCQPGARLQAVPYTSTGWQQSARLWEVRPGRKSLLLSDRALGGVAKVEEYQGVRERQITGTTPRLPWDRSVRWIVTRGMINSQPTLNLFKTCCSSWMQINLCGPIGFIPGY